MTGLASPRIIELLAELVKETAATRAAINTLHQPLAAIADQTKRTTALLRGIAGHAASLPDIDRRLGEVKGAVDGVKDQLP